jgi:endonuclease YncB( thermonuclease family)
MRYVRLKGIESYELASENKWKAVLIAERWTDKYKNVEAELIATQSSSDKYGRIVGSIFIGNVDLASMLVEAGDAWFFNHKKK